MSKFITEEPMATYSSADIPQPGKERVTKVITLKKGETAWHPGTTKHLFHGPCTLTYTVWPDGGVDVEKT